jgi:hypothetical protein
MKGPLLVALAITPALAVTTYDIRLDSYLAHMRFLASPEL